MPNSSKSIRKLVAIMFTDIAGYTAIMQKDEQYGIQLRKRHREVFERYHKQHQGEIIQYYGDGTLSVFNSAIEAVKCAISIQGELSTGDPSVPLRIGIHQGDVVYTGTEIIGDSVNVAARVESLGVPGAILVSDKLNDELKNQKELSTQSMGSFHFKNVSKPVEVFAISNSGLTIPQKEEMKGKVVNSTKSIAVLPLVNMSSSQENEYFSDGMTEEIINALTKIKDLNVTSRTSSFYFKNKDIPVKEMGKELNVSTILEGSVRLSGNKMRITTQLVDVHKDTHFWSETFDRSVEDIFAVQDEISLLIANRLKQHLGYLDIDDHLVDAPDISVESYKKYLKARYHILKMSEKDIRLGMSILKEVIEEQPDFAYAYLGMHMAYIMLGTIGFMSSAKAYQEGFGYLQKALELQPELPECQLQLSWIAYLMDWDIEKAYQHLQNGLKIRPFVDLYQSMSSTLASEGKYEAAMNYIDIALQMDPFSNITQHLKGFILYDLEQYEEAIPYFEKSLEINPESQVSLLEWIQSLILLDRVEDAFQLIDHIELSDDDSLKIGALTMLHSASGNHEEAQSGIKKLEGLMETEGMERAWFLLIYSYVLTGNHDKALTMLEFGLENRIPMIHYLLRDPILKPLRKEGRYQKVFDEVYKKGTA